MTKLQVLILDDEKSFREEISEFLTENGFVVFKASLPSEAFSILKKQEIDVAIVDIRLPEMDGLTVLEKIKSSYSEIEVIMITGHGDMNSVINAMRLGASEFFTKPFRLLEIKSAIERTKRFILLQKRLKEAELSYSVISVELQNRIGHRIIAKSPEIKSVIDLMSKVAKSDSTSILITGESGTGKELVARGIHYLSSRKNNIFYPVNCSAIPESLFESEFFGHTKGSFTGAVENKAGWFEIATKGTLFLDEIGDMHLNLQTKLLRVLEEKKISRIGSPRQIYVDVRIIASTNQDIDKMQDENKFRLDLYHRLNSFMIHIPPLRERKEDIPAILDYFVKFYSEKMKKNITHVDKKFIKSLMHYDFPGNVRELRNIVERAVILTEGDTLKLKHGLPLIGINDKDLECDEVSEEETFDLKFAEKNLVLKAFKKMEFNKTNTAKLLHITRQSLDRRIKKYNL